jgi:hypothetical protein
MSSMVSMHAIISIYHLAALAAEQFPGALGMW